MASGRPIQKPLKVPQRARHLDWNFPSYDQREVEIVEAMEPSDKKPYWHYRVQWQNKDGLSGQVRDYEVILTRSYLKPLPGRTWVWEEDQPDGSA